MTTGQADFLWSILAQYVCHKWQRTFRLQRLQHTPDGWRRCDRFERALRDEFVSRLTDEEVSP